jgi:hypothetical protein
VLKQPPDGKSMASCAPNARGQRRLRLHPSSAHHCDRSVQWPVTGRLKYLPVGLTMASMPPTSLTGATQTRYTRSTGCTLFNLSENRPQTGFPSQAESPELDKLLEAVLKFIKGVKSENHRSRRGGGQSAGRAHYGVGSGTIGRKTHPPSKVPDLAVQSRDGKSEHSQSPLTWPGGRRPAFQCWNKAHQLSAFGCVVRIFFSASIAFPKSCHFLCSSACWALLNSSFARLNSLL